MPNINLIAARREEQLRLTRLTRTLFLAFVASLALVGTVGLVETAQRVVLSSQLQMATARMARLQPVLDDIDRIQRETASLAPKVATLKTAKEGTTKWRAILQVVSGAIPDDAYLTTLSTTGTADDTAITLSGAARDQTVVGDMMTRLQTHPLFDHVDLRVTQVAVSQVPGSVPDAKHSGNTFDVSAHLRGTPSPPTPTPAKDKGAKSNG